MRDLGFPASGFWPRQLGALEAAVAGDPGGAGRLCAVAGRRFAHAHGLRWSQFPARPGAGGPARPLGEGDLGASSWEEPAVGGGPWLSFRAAACRRGEQHDPRVSVGASASGGGRLLPLPAGHPERPPLATPSCRSPAAGIGQRGPCASREERPVRPPAAHSGGEGLSPPLPKTGRRAKGQSVGAAEPAGYEGDRLRRRKGFPRRKVASPVHQMGSQPPSGRLGWGGGGVTSDRQHHQAAGLEKGVGPSGRCQRGRRGQGTRVWSALGPGRRPVPRGGESLLLQGAAARATSTAASPEVFGCHSPLNPGQPR